MYQVEKHAIAFVTFAVSLKSGQNILKAERFTGYSCRVPSGVQASITRREGWWYTA